MPKPNLDGYVARRLLGGLSKLSQEAIERLLKGLEISLANDQKEISKLITEALRNEMQKEKIIDLMLDGKYAEAEAIILQRKK